MRTRLLIVVLLLLGTGVADYAFSRPELEHSRLPLSEFPRTIGDWTLAGEQSIDQGSMAILQVDDYIMRAYRNSKGETIGLYVGYFVSQGRGKGIHSPRQCLPGAGWTALLTREIPFPKSETEIPGASINMYLMGKGSDRQLYLWWYQGRGRIYADEFLNKFYHVWDSMTKRRTDGALVRVNMAVSADFEYSLRCQTDFVRSMSCILPLYIPE